MSERLNKYIAFHLGLSRREADDLIADEAVLVNGTIATLGGRVEPGQLVTVKGQNITEKGGYTYILLNKPEGYVSSRRQQGDIPTLYELLPKELHHLKPVGRLDKNSSGLLVLTDDGEMAFQMTHPKFYKVKVYEVSLATALQPLHQQMISDFGIQLEDGPSKLSLEKVTDDAKQWLVTMHEGRNRQIRRTFDSLGYTVTRLHRTSFGPYTLGNLQPGKYETIEKRA